MTGESDESEAFSAAFVGTDAIIKNNVNNNRTDLKDGIDFNSFVLQVDEMSIFSFTVTILASGDTPF